MTLKFDETMKKMGVGFLSLNPCEKFSSLFMLVQKFLLRRKSRQELNEKDLYEVESSKEKHIALLEEIEEVKTMLKYANVEFNLQTNSDLIGSCIYNIEALETKYNYLLKEARKEKIRCDAKAVCVTG